MKKIERSDSPFDHPIFKGGAGSGNHGHAGVPGQRGGSAPGGGAVASFDHTKLTSAKGPQEMRDKIRAMGGKIVDDKSQPNRAGSGQHQKFVVQAPDGKGYVIEEEDTGMYARTGRYTTRQLMPGTSGFVGGGKFHVDGDGKLVVTSSF